MSQRTKQTKRERTVARLMALVKKCQVAVYHMGNDTTEAPDIVWLLDIGTTARLQRALRRALPPDVPTAAKWRAK